jgi:Ca2+-binding RTX toxin-like protein
MKRQPKAWIVAGAVMCALAFVESKANALQNLGNPLGNTATTIYIGANSLGNSYVVWCNANQFAILQIGTSSGLSDDFNVNGGNGNDHITVLDVAVADPCASGLSQPPTYGGHFLDIYGNGGSDIIFERALGSVDTYLIGGDQNDQLISNSSISRLFGGEGNDQLDAAAGASASDALFGENGNDCLHDASNSYVSFDCGAGTDTIDFRNTLAGTVGCESKQSFVCPFTSN